MGKSNAVEAQLREENQRLKLINNVLTMENSILKKKPVLSGRRVLVIGDVGRKVGYREIIEKYGGEFSFLDGIEDATKVKHAADSCDVIFHITWYGFHTIDDQIRASNNRNVIKIQQCGLKGLEDAVIHLGKMNSDVIKGINK